MGVYSAYPDGNKRNWYNLASEAECKELETDKNNKKLAQGLSSIIRISNNTIIQNINVVRIEDRQLNSGRSDSEYLTMILSLGGVNLNS